MYFDHIQSDINVLLGKVLVSVTGKAGDETVRFIAESGEQYLMYHSQDCCESVSVEDIVGDLHDLVGSPVLLAEEVVSSNKNPDGTPEKEYQDSFTWTFYKLATAKGYVTIRWYGESNGYYSESVDFILIPQGAD